MTIEEAKDEFIKIYTQNIKREGSDKLLDYIVKSDFFTAPASYRFHSNYDGGLCQHTLNVYYRLKKLVEVEYGENYSERVSDETIAICALLHDVCKIDFYTTEMRNVKVDGVWVQKPRYVVKDGLPYGHGEKSVYIINGYMRLTREEAIAINWHAGGFDARALGGSLTFSQAFYQYPLSVLLHIADLEATYLDEQVFD